MPYSNFFIDSSSIKTAYAAYTDINMTTPAPDGWYSNCGVSRQQSGGRFVTPGLSCEDASCVLQCAVTGGVSVVFNAAAGPRWYKYDIDLGTATGAVRIDMVRSGAGGTEFGMIYELGDRVYPDILPSGYQPDFLRSVQRSYNSIGAFNFTNILITAGGGSCAPVANTNINVYKRNATGVFASGGLTQRYRGPLMSNSPVLTTNPIVQYIPKADSYYNILNVNLIQFCITASSNWTIRTYCPVKLQFYKRSVAFSTPIGAGSCAAIATNNLWYLGRVRNPDPTWPNAPQVDDFAFADENSVNFLPDGFYKVPTQNVSGNNPHQIEVVNGIIRSSQICT